MSKMIIKIFLNTATFYLASLLLPLVSLKGIEAAIWAGIILGVINLALRPLLFLLTLPVNLLTLGLFTLLINTWMVMLADKLTPGLSITGFWPACAIAVALSVVNMAVK